MEFKAAKRYIMKKSITKYNTNWVPLFKVLGYRGVWDIRIFHSLEYLYLYVICTYVTAQ